MGAIPDSKLRSAGGAALRPTSISVPSPRRLPAARPGTLTSSHRPRAACSCPGTLARAMPPSRRCCTPQLCTRGLPALTSQAFSEVGEAGLPQRPQDGQALGRPVLVGPQQLQVLQGARGRRSVGRPSVRLTAALSGRL